MRWLAVIGVVLVAFVVLTMATDKQTDVHKMMAKVRAAKRKKAAQRSKEVSYTPPQKSEGGIMKVA